jgi:small-conductance mechanosensitive channel
MISLNWSIPGLAQSLTPSTTVPEVKKIDTQAELVQIKQLSETDLRSKIVDLKKTNVKLESEILDLKQKQAQLTQNIRQLEDLQSKQKDEQMTTQPIADLDKEIGDYRTQLFEVEKTLAQKQSEQSANLVYLEAAEKILATKQEEVKKESNQLQAEILGILGKVVVFVLLIGFYFLVLQTIYWATEKFITNGLPRQIIRLLANLVIFLATSITVLYAFIGNLSYLLAGFGVLSAALVVALQDFVSSFFAWVWINIRRIYRLKDVIQINANTGKITGIVTEIGIFRTTMKELSVSAKDSTMERPSGRIVSFPNNLILKEPLTNFTRDNRLLWHDFSVVVTFESDFELAKKLAEEVMDKVFTYCVDHKDQYLDDVYNLKYIYAPKLYMSIDNSGPKIEIWFAARYGKYRDVLEMISRDLLKSFLVYGIDLAYPTTRVIPTPINMEDEKVRSITFHKNPGVTLQN